MFKQFIEKTIQKKFASAGIQIDGGQPWDIQVRDHRFYSHLFKNGTVGLGESYMNQWIDIPRVDEFTYRIAHSAMVKDYSVVKDYSSVWYVPLLKLGSLIFNMQSKARAGMVGKQHYDLDNDLFKHMLDKRMTYSCAYWNEAQNLDEAQEAKLELICQKLMLKPGMRVLDIGCGWGSFAKYAAEKYGVHVVGITIAAKQLELAKELCQGLPIELYLQDYREISGTFDRIVSLAQFEAVGYKNFRTYMQIMARVLKDDGLFLLHTIGNNESIKVGEPWLDKYIFPNGMLPSIAQIGKSAERLFVMEDWHNFGSDYDKTLLSWHHNFVAAWDVLKSRYDEIFYRMWTYYLLVCAGAFRARKIQVWQVVFSKYGVPGGYKSVRF